MAEPERPGAPDGFDIRCLRSLEELRGPWLDLVAAVFGPLGASRQYFERHWDSDTDESRDLRAVFVAVERASGQMVSTVRVFRRALLTRASGEVAIGGVGEVATLPRLRGRGLARLLLSQALEHMAAAGLCGALHAAAGAVSIYRSLGFREVANPFCMVPLAAAAADGSAASVAGVVAPIAFEDDSEWRSCAGRLAPLQAAFVAGLDAFKRSEQYWERWMRWPAEALDEQGRPEPGLMRGFELLSEGGVTVAYLIAKVGQSASAAVESGAGAGSGRPALAVLDYASAALPGSQESEVALLRLLDAARAAFFGELAGEARVSLPSLLAPAACREAPADEAQGTWMYRGVGGGAGPAVDAARHLVMPLDEF